jgi:hypothetical protein
MYPCSREVQTLWSVTEADDEVMNPVTHQTIKVTCILPSATASMEQVGDPIPAAEAALAVA